MDLNFPIIKRYQLKEFEVEVEIDKHQSGKLVLVFPYNVPYEDWAPINKRLNKPPTLQALIPEADFDYDMNILVPEAAGRSLVDSCIMQLVERIKIHVNKFDQILPPDLEAYVAESVLVMYSISKSIQPPMNIEEQKHIFKTLLFQLSNDIGIPVNLKFNA